MGRLAEVRLQQVEIVRKVGHVHGVADEVHVPHLRIAEVTLPGDDVARLCNVQKNLRVPLVQEGGHPLRVPEPEPDTTDGQPLVGGEHVGNGPHAVRVVRVFDPRPDVRGQDPEEVRPADPHRLHAAEVVEDTHLSVLSGSLRGRR